MEQPARRPPKKFHPHPFAYHHEMEVIVDNVTNEGAGVARVDGWVVFVPFALPGERVRCRVFRNSKNYSEADLIAVIEPSPHRREPVCPLFGTCGGCQYQNLVYPEQLKLKRKQVAELLTRLARIEHEVEEVISSPVEFAYRSKITPHFQKPREGSIGEIGFLRCGSRQALVDVEHCPIAMPELNKALTEARAAVHTAAASYKNGATVLLRAASGQVLKRPDELAVENVLGMRFEFQAGDFFQNNPFILPQFVEYVLNEARATGAPHLLDAYCGSGLFGICAAPHFAEVTGVEISETAVAKARHNAELNGLANCTFTAADAQQIFADVSQAGADTVVIIDPPRAGCSAGFLDQLQAFGPKGIVYVSCNPATQMRDLALLDAAGYELRRVQPFDLFPQTRHLECVMTLVKKDGLAE
jgi:tRNA/tmRNA/rRNA uracil-C5-methylase (TrmA/RlmC/RlmD family)